MIDLLRLVNAAPALLCLIGIVPLAGWWRAQTRPARFLLLALAWLIGATGFAAVESMLHSAPGGWRTPLSTVALIWAATGIVLLHRARRTHRKDPS